MEENSKFYDNFEQQFKLLLLDRATKDGFLNGSLLEIEELDELWDAIAPEYMADSISLLNDYPTVAFAWAAYFGLGVASLWDGDWDSYKNCDKSQLYTQIRDKRGFDNMDEYILEQMLGYNLESEENIKLENLLRSLSQLVISIIRKEQIVFGTTESYYVFAIAVKQLFKIGVSITLRELGYRYEKMTLPN